MHPFSNLRGQLLSQTEYESSWRVGTDHCAADATIHCGSATPTFGTTHSTGARISINQSPATHAIWDAELSSAA